MDPENDVLSDEAIAKQEEQAEVDSGKLRERIVAELGLTDDETNKETIDKFVEREAALRGGFGKLLKSHKALKLKVKSDPTPPPQKKDDEKTFDPEAIRKDTEMTVKQQLEQRDLDEMEYPDEIKAEIKNIARIKDISVRKAEKDPYIGFLVEQAKAAGRIDEAAVPHTQHSTTAPSNKAPTFDMYTEEGRKAFDAWKASKGSKK